MRALLTLTLLLILGTTSAQVTKLRADYISIRILPEYAKEWPEWDEWEESGVLITVDLDNLRIEVHSKHHQEYDITSVGEPEFKDRFKRIPIKAVDEEGIKCTLELVEYYNTGTLHLYVKWSNMQVVYQIRSN